MADSVKKLSDQFSKLELSHESIKKEAAKNQVSPAELAVQFIQSNPALRSQYETQLRSIPIANQNEKEIEKLVIVILESEDNAITEKIKEKDLAIIQKKSEIRTESNQQRRQTLEKEVLELEKEKDELGDKGGDIAMELIPLKAF
ncbi:MAG: hypothetical protein COX30_01710 [Candidatus Moranbacteria bacterium CG23_combo_of_CG06-09_8_20_14_all_39_10]|nr:MAG: hypothetical protein COX30_01710 [Candidatus Moranbacteria bacterium CG23_combo_of_CG06-09_8_20_14_all_39_10]